MSTSAQLPPWIEAQLQQLLKQRGHAWLLHGPSGLGQYNLAFALARAWLCEQPSPSGACGQCTSCHAMQVRTHADIFVLMPETHLHALQWPLSEQAQSEIDDKKRKPSKEIRVDAMRDAVQFTQRTNARGKGKVILVFPAEQMNVYTANTLLKTLEEPPGDVKFVLASESAHQLLPTIRSRCSGHSMHWPDTAQATTWLQSQGVGHDEAHFLLKATGGRPEDALNFRQQGLEQKQWAAFPRAMFKGEVAFVKDWQASRLLDALQKLCHDVWAKRCSAPTRFFAESDVPQTNASLTALARWSQSLLHAARTIEHPLNLGLLQETLVVQAQTTLN